MRARRARHLVPDNRCSGDIEERWVVVPGARIDFDGVARKRAAGTRLSIKAPFACCVVDLEPCERARADARVEKGIALPRNGAIDQGDEIALLEAQRADGVDLARRFRREHGGGPRALAVMENRSDVDRPGRGGLEAAVHRLVVLGDRGDLGAIVHHLGLTRLGRTARTRSAARKHGGGAGHSSGKDAAERKAATRDTSMNERIFHA